MTNDRTLWGNGARYTLRRRYILGHPGVRRGLVALAVALMLLAIAGIQYRRIVVNEIGGLRAELEQQRRAAVDAQYAQQLVDAFGTGKKQIAVLEQKLQVEGVQSTLVHEMEKLCRLNSVKLLAQSYQEGKVAEGKEGSDAVLKHELVVAGSYPNLRRLIRDMEKLPTLSFIEEASFSKSAGQSFGQDARLKLSLRLSTYYRVAAPKPVK